MMTAKFLRCLATASLVVLVSSPAFAAKTNPKLSHSVSPVYPSELLDKGVEGKAVVQVVVTESGDVENVELISADHPEFGTAAVDAVKQWKFDPATQDGKAIRMTVQFPILFNPPPDKKLNAMEGREVFKEIKETIIPENQLDHPLRVVKAPVAYWPAGLEGDPSTFQVITRVVIGPDGAIFNPEASADTPKVLIMPALKAVAEMTFDPPIYKGKPTYAVGEAIVLFADAPPPPEPAK